MTVHRGISTTLAEFVALWSDRSLTLDQIGARLGISGQAVAHRAHSRGLPPRPAIKPNQKFDRALLRELYIAGVSTAAIGALFGMTSTRVGKAARHMGLSRPRATRHHPVTIADWRAEKLRQAMERDAQATRAAMRAMGMEVGRGHG